MIIITITVTFTYMLSNSSISLGHLLDEISQLQFISKQSQMLNRNHWSNNSQIGNPKVIRSTKTQLFYFSTKSQPAIHKSAGESIVNYSTKMSKIHMSLLVSTT